MKQVKWYDVDNEEVHGGIQLDNGDIICACCGTLYPADEQTIDYGFSLVNTYEDWIDFSETIID